MNKFQALRTFTHHFVVPSFQNPTEEKDKKEKTSSPSPLQDLEGSTNGGPAHSHGMMLPNGLTSEDEGAKAFKYVSEGTSNGLPYHMTVDSYGRTPGSPRQPSPSEEDLTKNHSPGVTLGSVSSHAGPIIKPGEGGMGLPPTSAHGMVGSLQVPGVGLTNGIGLVNGGGGPPGEFPRPLLGPI